MSKVAHYLQEHLIGEVMTSSDARRYFATDTSILTLTPAIVAYPHNENDVRKTARFTWQLAERGRVIPMTARGSGTDQAGGAIGSGIVVVFPAHMNKILELDPKTGSVAVQPGLNYGKLQQTLQTHGRFLPPFPASVEYSTIGGAMGNNASGEKSVKYGSTRNFVRSLRVVLANGEVIETRRLNKRELGKKMGLSSMEGEIYRSLDKLLEENKEIVKKTKLEVTKNSAGYALSDIKQKDGSLDLTPLFIGAQGTLGIITEAIIDTEPYNPAVTLVVASFDDIDRAAKAVLDLRKLPDAPSALEMVDSNLLNFIDTHNPNQLKGTLEKPFHKITLLIEFDNFNARAQKRMAKKTKKIVEEYGGSCQIETDPEQQDHLWRIRHSSASVTAFSDNNNAKSLPVIEDGVVPVVKLVEFLSGAYAIFDKYGLQVAVWGHAGDANLHMQPFLDLSQLGDRQKLFRVMEDYHQLVMSLGGSTNGEHGDGRLRAPYLRQLYGEDVYELFRAVKKIFDPYGTLNPGVKVDVSIDDLKPMLRQEYSMKHLYDHMPRT
jgi:FAD/FMN-containing dehydrogenase